MQNNCIDIKRKKTKAFGLFFIYCFFVAFVVLSSPAYATMDGGWYTNLESAGSILRMLALSGGAVGLAWCGIEYTYGSEEVARKAKSKAIVIIGATAAIFALPYLIKAGKVFGSKYKWDPSQLK